MLNETNWLSDDCFLAGLSKPHYIFPQEASDETRISHKSNFFHFIGHRTEKFWRFLKLSNCLCDPSDKRKFFSGTKNFFVPSEN